MDDDAKTTNEIRIRCKGTGKAPITVAWKKFDISDRNKEVTYSQDIRFHSDGTLVLASSDARQRDDGYYQCFVKNTEGTTFSRKVRVKIRSKLKTGKKWTIIELIEINHVYNIVIFGRFLIAIQLLFCAPACYVKVQ